MANSKKVKPKPLPTAAEVFKQTVNAPARESVCICGDCVDIMKAYNGRARLVVADPPYGIGQDYDVYQDNLSRDDYLAWSRLWVAAAASALTADGSLWIAIGDQFVSELDVMCKSMDFTKQAHVIHYFTFGQNQRNNFTRSHIHWLYYVKDRKHFTFNANDPLVRVPSARQQLYKDKRANPAGRLPDDTWILRPAQLPEGFTPLEDTWHFSRICGTFKDKAEVSPNQMRVEMLERIVRLCSNRGDLVVDPFGGTFTAGVACARTGRNYVGMDLSEKCVAYGKQRVERELLLADGKGPGTQQALFDDKKVSKP